MKRSDIAEVFGVPTPATGVEVSRDAAVTADQAAFLNVIVREVWEDLGCA